MKRLSASFLIMSLVAAVGCGDDSVAPGTNGDQPPPPEPVAPGPCTPGEVRECDETLQDFGHKVSCLHGLQTCTEESTWTACEPDSFGVKVFQKPRRWTTDEQSYHRDLVASIAWEEIAEAGLDAFYGEEELALYGEEASEMMLLAAEGNFQEAARFALSMPTPAVEPLATSTPSACSDPCDPDCQAYDEDPGAVNASGAILASWRTGRPNRWEHGEEAMDRGGYDSNCNNNNDCENDYFCDGSECDPWQPGQSQGGGVDLTVGVGCDDEIPICNRGNTDFSGNLDFGGYNVINNPGGFADSYDPTPNTGAFEFTCSLSGANIPSGRCIMLDESDCSSNFTADGYCQNPLYPLLGPCWYREYLVDTVMVDPDDNINELREDNNWGYAASSGCTTVNHRAGGVDSDTFTLDCPTGTQGRWTKLMYDIDGSSLSGTSDGRRGQYRGEVELRVDTGGAQSLVTTVVGSGNCTGGCFEDLDAILGAPDKRRDPLTFEATFFASYYGDVPTIDSYEIQYTCESTE